jgi:hypothetical protein
MACPLYFLPGFTADHLSVDLLRDVGLGDRLVDCLDGKTELRDRLALRNIVGRGPDGMNGLLLAAIPPAGRLPSRIGHHPESQAWTRLTDQLWMGVTNGEPVTPADLLRPGALPGHEVTLGEHVWRVPIIRRGGLRPALPQTLVRRNGRVEMRLRREWQPVWEMSGRVWELLTVAQGAEWEEVYDLCRQILQINYRVDDAELELLAPLDTDSFRLVFQSAVDWPLVEQLLAGSLPEEVPPGTNPPEAAPAAA